MAIAEWQSMCLVQATSISATACPLHCDVSCDICHHPRCSCPCWPCSIKLHAGMLCMKSCARRAFGASDAHKMSPCLMSTQLPSCYSLCNITAEPMCRTRRSTKMRLEECKFAARPACLSMGYGLTPAKTPGSRLSISQNWASALRSDYTPTC